MHERGVVHRDLKPENILLSDKTREAHVLIADFGLGRFISQAGQQMDTVCGTHHYLAPELVRCDRGDQETYDQSIDVWGVGLIMFIMLFGYNPFLRESNLQTHQAIVDCKYTFPKDDNASKTAKEMIKRMVSCLPPLDAEDRVAPYLRPDRHTPHPHILAGVPRPLEADHRRRGALVAVVLRPGRLRRAHRRRLRRARPHEGVERAASGAQAHQPARQGRRPPQEGGRRRRLLLRRHRADRRDQGPHAPRLGHGRRHRRRRRRRRPRRLPAGAAKGNLRGATRTRPKRCRRRPAARELRVPWGESRSA